MNALSYKVSLDETRYPGKTVVVVEEPGLTLRWPFNERHDAQRKADTENARLREELTS